MTPSAPRSKAAKLLGLIALALAISSVTANGWAVFERPPRRDTLRLLAYFAFGAGILGALLGLVAGLKRFPVAWLALPLGALGAAWQFSWAV